MKLKRGKGWHKVPAHREYYLTMVLPSGERLEQYTPYVYRTAAKARKEANRMNQGRATRGQVVVEFKDVPESISYDLGSIKL